MNPRMNAGGLQSPLTEPTIIPWVLRRHNRLHDSSPGYVDSGVPISVIGIAAGLTDKGGLTLAVLFCAVSTHMARSGRVAWVDRVQWHSCKSGLVGKELTELSK